MSTTAATRINNFCQNRLLEINTPTSKWTFTLNALVINIPGGDKWQLNTITLMAISLPQLIQFFLTFREKQFDNKGIIW